MKAHVGHKVLGHFCWVCQRRTKAGTPGWTKADHNDGPKSTNMESVAVTWKDGTHDSGSPCIICHVPSCSYPVHAERYREINAPKQEMWELKELGEIELQNEEF